MSIDEFLAAAVAQGASDLHLKAGARPALRIDGELFVQESPVISPDEMERLFLEISTERQRQVFTVELEADFAYQSSRSGHFRVNVSMQNGAKAIVCRPVKTIIPSLEELGLPPVCRDLALKNSGLVIITGPTGCGKSTTLASMMDYVNHNQKKKIVTIEDPVEYIHHDIKSIFYQREVSRDTRSFAGAMVHAMRQDPDIILIGEMRDLDTMSAALTAAETGHLVLTTLHTPGAAESVNRFIDVFPPRQQTQARLQLAEVLQGVIYQVLVKRADRPGRIAALEIMLGVPAVKNLIREGKMHQAASIFQSGAAQGMQSLNRSLAGLVNTGVITRHEALDNCNDAEELSESLKGSPKNQSRSG
jgi:twitching motility protein PilT